MKMGWDEGSRPTVRTFTANAIAARERQIAIEDEYKVSTRGDAGSNIAISSAPRRTLGLELSSVATRREPG